MSQSISLAAAVADATTLTEAGYVGEDVETILHKLLLAAGMDVQVAQRGIVYIDKLGGGRVHGAKDMRRGVQHALLKMIEGTVAHVPPNGGYKAVGETCVPLDTTNVLFLCGGAFVGLDEVVARRLGRRAFGSDQAGSAVGDEGTNPLRRVSPEDVEGFGLIPELIGRLPVIATLDALGVDDLVRILRGPKESLIDQYRKLLIYRQARLDFTDGAVRAIAELAHERGTDARGLRAIVERVLNEAGPLRPRALGELHDHRGDRPGRGRRCLPVLRHARRRGSTVAASDDRAGEVTKFIGGVVNSRAVGDVYARSGLRRTGA
ncbi:AAA family ATPase [Planctomyces sp. SH-PL62]|uniref:AAA family ATPase n=1 Tax=Planctomyces sp. SH-PL62 TaxID=1636152 RepID=UPI00078C79DE|nr:AAA family ATPase [Planctomyces sp. SH-PL62]AMV38379.1 ATP-dependent Clp protease ATP-binding subunit ClpX [Planctomyces sp. SH-PL62]